MSGILSSVDYVVLKENILVVAGWIFHKTMGITEVRFRISERDAEHVTADYGVIRRDVAKAFPNNKFASCSGYFALGAFSGFLTNTDSILLDCVLADGSIISIPIPSYARRQKFQHLRELTTQRFKLLCKRTFGGLYDSIRSSPLRPLSAYPDELAALLRPCERNNVCVIVDHDLGGGANRYREQLVRSLNVEGRTAIILTYNITTLTYAVILQNCRMKVRYSIPDENFLLGAVKNLRIADIVYNNGVSFARPEQLFRVILRLKTLNSARLKVLFHDYFLICPSQHLLNYEGTYCGIPHESVCSGCLQANKFGYTTLFAARDIPTWRLICNDLLNAADEIITFSNDTVRHLLRAYPGIDRSRISMSPHDTERGDSDLYCHIQNIESLCVGVVGRIGLHKGAKFVQSLAREIKRRQLNVKIKIIGTIEVDCDLSIVTQTGSYDRDHLATLIENSGANVMLFPSICPETFSYVVQELVSLEVPVACFNLGAPAERLDSYSKGLVLGSTDPADVLDELMSFHKRIYSNTALDRDF